MRTISFFHDERRVKQRVHPQLRTAAVLLFYIDPTRSARYVKTQSRTFCFPRPPLAIWLDGNILFAGIWSEMIRALRGCPDFRVGAIPSSRAHVCLLKRPISAASRNKDDVDLIFRLGLPLQAGKDSNVIDFLNREQPDDVPPRSSLTAALDGDLVGGDRSRVAGGTSLLQLCRCGGRGRIISALWSVRTVFRNHPALASFETVRPEPTFPMVTRLFRCTSRKLFGAMAQRLARRRGVRVDVVLLCGRYNALDMWPLVLNSRSPRIGIRRFTGSSW